MVSLQTSQQLIFTADLVIAMARGLPLGLGPLISTLHGISESEWTQADPMLKPITSLPQEEQGQGLGQQQGQQLKDEEEQKPVKGTGRHQRN